MGSFLCCFGWCTTLQVIIFVGSVCFRKHIPLGCTNNFYTTTFMLGIDSILFLFLSCSSLFFIHWVPIKVGFSFAANMWMNLQFNVIFKNYRPHKHVASMWFQDPSFTLRKPLLYKIHKLLKEQAIPDRYACAFALASMDCAGELRDDVSFPLLRSLNAIYLVYLLLLYLLCSSNILL